MDRNREKIDTIKSEISGALDFWQSVLNMADADEWAYYLDYSDADLLNALYIFNHIAQNKAIKSGHIEEYDAIDKMTKFKEAIKEAFGFDSVELTQKVLGDKKTNQK